MSLWACTNRHVQSDTDVDGALLYNRGADVVEDLALGPGGLVYSLESEESDDHAAVVPYRP